MSVVAPGVTATERWRKRLELSGRSAGQAARHLLGAVETRVAYAILYRHG